MKQGSSLILLLFLFQLSSIILKAQTTFNESTDTLLISNSSYELGILKLNGAITHITKKTTGEKIILGSLYQNLWTIGFSNKTQLNSSEFAGTYDYVWDDLNKKLEINYISANDVSVNVSITASNNEYIDFQLSLSNSSDLIINIVSFPNTLQFDESKIQNGLFPDKPGLMLSSDFFAKLNELPDGIVGIHPPSMADYLGLQTNQTTFALYSLWGTEPLQINGLGFKHLQGTTAGMIHLFSVWRPSSYSWTSVPVRLRLASSFEETIQHYRTDNEIDEYTPLKEKLGEKYNHIVQSPYIDFAAGWFGQYDSWYKIFRTLPAPAILYISGYYQGGFHGHFPDVIPPNPEFGTTEEFKAALDSAHAYNFLTMPMILPNWWHENSPTILGLGSQGLTIDSIAQIDEDGNPSYSSWSLAGIVDNGYNVSPRVPFVQDRLNQLLNTLSTDIGFDMIYEDVIGAGNAGPDYNTYAPDTIDTEGWLDHTRKYKDHLLVTETGSDIFAETEVGFLGGGHGPDWNDSPNAKAWPMSAFLMKDKVLRYHYWGMGGTNSKTALAWNLAFGYMLNISYNPSKAEEAPGSKWYDVLNKFHTKIISKYADQLLNSYSELNSGKVMNCTYDSMIVIANRDTINGFEYNGHVISSSGVLAYTPDEKTISGIFSSFNGQKLAGEDQFLIVEKYRDSIVVSHPLGESTPLTLNLLNSWTVNDTLWAKAYDKEGRFIDALEVNCNQNTLIFNCLDRVQGYLVDHFTIVKSGEQPEADWQIYFNDEYAGEMYLGNKDFYEIKVANHTTAIYYIIDKRSGDTISLGSEWGLLWNIGFPDAPAGSQNVDPINAPSFDPSYSVEKEWSMIDSTLTFNYISTKLKGSVSITISALNHFDLQMSLTNSSGYSAKDISFPRNLIFGYDSNTTALLPFQFPGVRLKPSFFQEQKNYASMYPNRFTSDFVSISNNKGNMAIYSLWEDQKINNVQLGLYYNHSGSYYYAHKYYTSIETGTSWTSPKIRFRIGDLPIETLHAFRSDNISDTSNYLLSSKMDSVTYAQYIKSPVIFNSFGNSTDLPFNSFANWASSLPSPSIMLLSSYYPNGKFGSHPDVLPTDNTYGTESEFKNMINELHVQQKLVVPYTIPNWWNENSPTVLNLSNPNNIESLTFKQADGSQTYITFNGIDYGYVMSANNDYVNQRVGDNISILKESFACDFVFEDKLNAMQINADHDAGYHQGWLNHLKNYKDSSILISSGYDRQFAFASGNFSTMYFDESLGASPLDYDFGDANWEYFPIWPFIFGDILINYQSDEYPTTDKDIFSWNMLFGCGLNYIPQNKETISISDSSWINVIGTFQSKALSKIVSEKMTNYSIIDDNMVKSEFNSIQVIRNNDLLSEHSYEGYNIAPEGALLKSSDGKLMAGILTSFNNKKLSPGEHYLIIEKSDKEQFIYHPKGAETPITFNRPLEWADSSRIKIEAVTNNNKVILERNITPSSISADLPKLISGYNIVYFILYYADYYSETDVSICNGDSLLWMGNYYSDAGTYYDSLKTEIGNDSVLTLNLYYYETVPLYLGNDTTLYTNETLTIDPGSGFETYYWNNGSEQQIFVFDASTEDSESSTIWLKATDFNNCIQSDTITITILNEDFVFSPEFVHIRIYPNPAFKKLTINAQELIKTVALQFYNLDGSMCKEYNIEPKTCFELDISDLKRDVYFIEMHYNNRNYIYKLLVK